MATAIERHLRTQLSAAPLKLFFGLLFGVGWFGPPHSIECGPIEANRGCARMEAARKIPPHSIECGPIEAPHPAPAASRDEKPPHSIECGPIEAGVGAV